MSKFHGVTLRQRRQIQITPEFYGINTSRQKRAKFKWVLAFRCNEYGIAGKSARNSNGLGVPHQILAQCS